MCLPNEYKVKLIREIWGVRCAGTRDMDSSPLTHLTHRSSLACGRHVNLGFGRMIPKKRSAPLRKYCSEYIVYGDFERRAPYSCNTTAYWVTLSNMVART